MKKFQKIAISLLLLIAITVSFASCAYIDKFKIWLNKGSTKSHDHDCDCYHRTEDGYTGGMSPYKWFHDEYEVYWLETYEEVLAAVELLKSHGSTIKPNIGFNYDTEILDSKFCFICEKVDAEPLEEGKNFFDRKIDGGTFYWYGFREAVTIESFLYNVTADKYDVITFKNTSIDNLDIDFLNCIDDVSKICFYSMKDNTHGTVDYEDSAYYISYNGVRFASIWNASRNDEYWIKLILPVEYQREFLDSFVIVK